MANKIASHVERLHKYLPFSPTHDQIYEEYQRSDDTLNLPTRALTYLKEALSSDPRIIVLTGDAGHGKTHLCRRVIEDHLGYTEEEARSLINSACDGTSTIGPKDGVIARALRIYKDFSEPDIETAARGIDAAWAAQGETTIICANEGRLRAVLEAGAAEAGCAALKGQFRESFEDGLVTTDGKIHIINLNYQSVASTDGEGLIAQTLHEWLDGRRWNVCQDCDSRDQCPILHNRRLLSPQASSLADQRRKRLEVLLGSLERLGTVITIREMLMMVAYLVTGGLKCTDVHEKRRKKPVGWQHDYAFYNLIFEKPTGITRDMLARIPVMLALPRLDPGARAIRRLDEQLLDDQDLFEPQSMDLIFEYRVGDSVQLIDGAYGIDQIAGYPRNRNERRSEAAFVTAVTRSLRRRAFFDQQFNDGDEMAWLGFEHGGDFLAIVRGDLQPARMTRLKNVVVRGFHTIQGLQTRSTETNLHLVDPAFGKATVHSAIIARKVNISKLKLVSKSRTWDLAGDGSRTTMARAVDWLEREIVVAVDQEGRGAATFALDLMTFDCISRAAAGFLAEEFYSHDVRRIKTFLGRLAEAGPSQDQDIDLFLHGSLRTVSIDDGIIQVGGGI